MQGFDVGYRSGVRYTLSSNEIRYEIKHELFMCRLGGDLTSSGKLLAQPLPDFLTK